MKSYDPKVVSFQRNAGYLHQKALRNRKTGSQIDAMVLLRQAVHKEPDNAEYLLDLSNVYSDMGLFEQSNRLLTRVMTLPNGPKECLYGMAINMLKQGDTARAESLLRAYVDTDTHASHEGDARRLLDEIEFAREMNYAPDRRHARAEWLMERGTSAMRASEYARAARLFKKCLSAGGGGAELYALLSLCNVMLNDTASARTNANLAMERARNASIGSVKAMCICAQVYNYLHDAEKSAACIREALIPEADSQEKRMLAAALCELGMHAEASKHINSCLSRTPYDKTLLHMAAVAAYNSGLTPKQALRHWERIRRLDPEDMVAAYYLDAAHKDMLPPRPMDYSYQLPREEVIYRVQLLSGYLSSGAQGLTYAWKHDKRLRTILSWAVSLNHTQLTRMALSLLSVLSDEYADEIVRAYAIRPDAPFALKLHALALVKLMSFSDSAIPDILFAAAGLPTEDEAMEGLGVGERQMIRYAAEYVHAKYGDMPVTPIAILWRAFKERRGSACDPVYHTEAGSAALALCYLQLSKRKNDIYTVSRWFGCSARQAAHIVRRIRDIVTREDEEDS